jgi:Cys-tRNA(Pro)/Cys-tRNA(Cys) deacylase
VTPAVDALERAGKPFRIVQYDHDPDTANYGAEASAALGVDGSQIFKTLLAALPNGELVVAVIPTVSQLDLKSLARAAGAKSARMGNPSLVERRTGYVVGGISPFGQRQRHRCFVDESAELYDEVYVSGGRRGLEVVVAPEAFVSVLDASFVDLTSRA